MYPDNSLSLVENFLRMTFGFPAEPYEVDPEVAKALDMLFILHADHEQNCSTSTVRLVGSSQANLFTSIAGGINALWGLLHGGANQAVLEMLRTSSAAAATPRRSSTKVKNKEDGVKLMGFGHRVYKNYDPRAKIVKKTATPSSNPRRGGRDARHRQGPGRGCTERRLLHRAQALPERRLLHRRDHRAMGIPTRMFTVLFALGRLPGWIAHWREMHNDPTTKIGRPRQLYTGNTERDYVAMGRPVDVGESREARGRVPRRSCAGGTGDQRHRRRRRRRGSPGATVDVHYVGVEYDSGEEFDSSWGRGESVEFLLNRLIPGWQEGIPHEGRRPSSADGAPALAYGPTGAGHRLSGKTLVFVIDLLGVS